MGPCEGLFFHIFPLKTILEKKNIEQQLWVSNHPISLLQHCWHNHHDHYHYQHIHQLRIPPHHHHMIPQSPSIATKESEQKDGRAAKTQMIQVSFSSSFIVLGGRWWKGIPAENKRLPNRSRISCFRQKKRRPALTSSLNFHKFTGWHGIFSCSFIVFSTGGDSKIEQLSPLKKASCRPLSQWYTSYSWYKFGSDWIWPQLTCSIY